MPHPAADSFEHVRAALAEAMELTADEPLTWFEFSPDGRRLALVRRGGLYLVNVE